MSAPADRRRHARRLAVLAALGGGLRLVERVSALAWLAFTGYVAWRLVDAAMRHGAVLLVLLVPLVVSTVLLMPSLLSRPDLGPRLVWPPRRRKTTKGSLVEPIEDGRSRVRRILKRVPAGTQK